MDLTKTRGALHRLVLEAVHKGPVTLASGKISDFYIDGRLVTLSATGLQFTAALMAEMLKGVEFDAVGGPTMGADPIVGALLYHFWSTERRSVSGFIIRKEAKAHGMQKMVEGPALPAGARVVLVEDVVTSGGSVIKAAQVVEANGVGVVKILALVDREEGAASAMADAGYDFAAVFTKAELTVAGS